MAITGCHMLLYTPEADTLRTVLKDVFGWSHVDAGGGWLIFATPPAEIGVHPSEGSTAHEISLMCDDLRATMAELAAKGIAFEGQPVEASFGVTVHMVLPGGVKVMLYEPRHASPLTGGQ